jgi:hypothetical protein
VQARLVVQLANRLQLASCQGSWMEARPVRPARPAVDAKPETYRHGLVYMWCHVYCFAAAGSGCHTSVPRSVLPYVNECTFEGMNQGACTSSEQQYAAIP